MSDNRGAAALRYGCAVGSIAVAICLRLSLDPLLGQSFVFSLSYFAIVLTAWYGGFGPAVAALLLGGLGTDYFLLPPRGSFEIAGTDVKVGMVLYLITGMGIAGLGGAMAAARRKAEAAAEALLAANENLEARILARTAELATSRQTSLTSEARMAGIVNSAMDAIVSVDCAQRVLLFNAAAEKMFRCTAAEAMGQPLDRFIPGRFRDQHRRHIEAFGHTGDTSRSMHSLAALSGLRSDGEEFPIEASISQIEVGGEKVFTVILRDVTNRRRAEAASVLLAAIVESSTDAIVGKDVNGIVTSWNGGAERMFGYTAGEMLGRSITRIIPPDRLAEEERTLAMIRRGERVGHFETVRVKKDGAEIDVSLTVSPIRDSTGRIVGASKVARDITDWKRATKALRESEERMHAVSENLNILNTQLEDRVLERTAQLDAANKELEAFSYSVSHDLRAPLRAVDGFSQAVLEDYGPLLPEEGRRYLATIRGSAQRMGALIDDLLAFSRLSRAPLAKQPVNTAALVRDVLEELAPEPTGSRVDIRVADLPPCEGDPALLRQVWVNLVSNALKYTGRRDAPVVEIGAEHSPSGAVYFVRDNGTGFDMQYAHKLFGVFQRLHRSDEFEGTGVGLAIVQRIVHRHGGSVWADAAVDQGAAFRFTLGGSSQS